MTLPGIRTLYLSFFSKDLYRDVAKNWKGLCFPYLLFILMIYWIPEMVNIRQTISDFITDEAPKYVEQMPEITIAKGEASIQEPVPFIISDRKKNRPVAIIDTSGQTTSLNSSEASLLVTRTHLILKLDPQNIRSIPLSDFGEQKITKKLVYDWLEFFNTIFIAVTFPFALLVSFGFHALQVVMLALLGGNIAKYFGLEMDFRTLVRLSVVCFTPAILLEAAHAMLNIQYPYSTLLSFLITAGYLYYAIGSNSEKSPADLKSRE
jgi:hypothetical protein